MKPRFNIGSFHFRLSLTYPYSARKACFIFSNKDLPSCSNMDPAVEVVSVRRQGGLRGKRLLWSFQSTFIWLQGFSSTMPDHFIYKKTGSIIRGFVQVSRTSLFLHCKRCRGNQLCLTIFYSFLILCCTAGLVWKTSPNSKTYYSKALPSKSLPWELPLNTNEVTFTFDYPRQDTSSPFSLANLLLGSLEPYKTNF